MLTDEFAHAAIKQFFADYRQYDCIDAKAHVAFRLHDGPVRRGSYIVFGDGLVIPEGEMMPSAGSDDRMALADMMAGLARHAARFPHLTTIVWRKPANFQRKGKLVRITCRVAFLPADVEIVPLSEFKEA